ncbi:RNA polymerase sigma-70 factor [Flavivirga spongiicola]|uniref:RNA polymerase sigma-70 factor n=1 Tax=Flavivirga spongiicola TaxID=421621 RepID=UPI002FBEA2C0
MKNSVSNINVSFASLLEKRDEVAYETLFRLYYIKLIHIAKSYLIYQEDAEEVVQDVFLKLWEQKSKFKTISNINGYMFSMTKNMCLDKLRHEKIKRKFIDNNLRVKAGIQYDFIKDEAASLLLESELEQRIMKSIDLLPEKCRQVFIKSRMEGLKHQEIADELGISHRTVENHVSKAIKHMKLHLKDFLTIFL